MSKQNSKLDVKMGNLFCKETRSYYSKYLKDQRLMN